MTIEDLRNEIRRFADERDWDQFHSPKNLVMALGVEVAELAEHFQWLTEDQSRNLPPKTRDEVATEIADVQIYLVRLADKLGIDILKAAKSKLQENNRKYPANQVKGSAKKYSRHDEQDSAK